MYKRSNIKLKSTNYHCSVPHKYRKKLRGHETSRHCFPLLRGPLTAQINTNNDSNVTEINPLPRIFTHPADKMWDFYSPSSVRPTISNISLRPAPPKLRSDDHDSLPFFGLLGFIYLACVHQGDLRLSGLSFGPGQGTRDLNPLPRRSKGVFAIFSEEKGRNFGDIKIFTPSSFLLVAAGVPSAVWARTCFWYGRSLHLCGKRWRSKVNSESILKMQYLSVVGSSPATKRRA
ncbi:hypothetical protein PoB_003949600 [Plakobranchus ocellatus]|uniref:Uncharacterized protein n=1 Tax=Plakobranchus ocellatus TaxID=259542 RepID=A0AAV4B2C1_9GAST|nr:hypothetical protein PoB_003949600 [Plakobranchus ocellatus]